MALHGHAIGREVAWEMIFIAYNACVNYCYSDAVIFATCLVQKVNGIEIFHMHVVPKFKQCHNFL